MRGGSGNISRYRELHSEHFCFGVCLADFRPSRLDTNVPNLGATNAHLVAQPLSLTHPERCAAKFSARKCRSFLMILHLRPNLDQNIVPEYLQHSPPSPVQGVLVPGKGLPCVGSGRRWHTNGLQAEGTWTLLCCCFVVSLLFCCCVVVSLLFRCCLLSCCRYSLRFYVLLFVFLLSSARNTNLFLPKEAPSIV